MREGNGGYLQTTRNVSENGGEFSISGVPFFNGFVSKSMVTQAAGDEHLLTVWLLLAAASAGVFLHAGIKFPWFVFFQKDSGLRPPEPPWNMRAAMVFVSALCIGLGVVYEPLYRLLPYAVDYEPYTGFHVVAQLQLLLFSGLAFFVMLYSMTTTDVQRFREFVQGLAAAEQPKQRSDKDEGRHHEPILGV